MRGCAVGVAMATLTAHPSAGSGPARARELTDGGHRAHGNLGAQPPAAWACRASCCYHAGSRGAAGWLRQQTGYDRPTATTITQCGEEADAGCEGTPSNCRPAAARPGAPLIRLLAAGTTDGRPPRPVHKRVPHATYPSQPPTPARLCGFQPSNPAPLRWNCARLGRYWNVGPPQSSKIWHGPRSSSLHR